MIFLQDCDTYLLACTFCGGDLIADVATMTTHAIVTPDLVWRRQNIIDLH